MRPRHGRVAGVGGVRENRVFVRPCFTTGWQLLPSSPLMKAAFAAMTLGVATLLLSGCYKTQEGRYQAGVPFSRDEIESRYERPVPQVYEAAKATLAFNGTLTSENLVAQVVTARINDRTVYVKVDEVEPRISRVMVQARRNSGRGDLDLAAEIDKQIALRLR